MTSEESAVHQRYAGLVEELRATFPFLRPVDLHLVTVTLLADQLRDIAPVAARRAERQPLRERGAVALQLALGHGSLAGLTTGTPPVTRPGGPVSRITDPEMWRINVEGAAVLGWLVAIENEQPLLLKPMTEIELRWPELDLGPSMPMGIASGDRGTLHARVERWCGGRVRDRAPSATSAVAEWLDALIDNDGSRWNRLRPWPSGQPGDSLCFPGPRDEGNALLNFSYRWGPVEDVHAGAADAEAIAPGRARLTGRELGAILTAASEICGQLWALRFHAPLSGYALHEAFTLAFPWDWDRVRLYVPDGEELPGDEARQAARRGAREALRPWSLQQEALVAAARASAREVGPPE